MEETVQPGAGGWLERYRGCLMEVIYLTDNNVYRDRARLSDFGDGWLEFAWPSNEVFLVPMSSVRLMKVLDSPGGDASRLVRPVHPSS